MTANAPGSTAAPWRSGDLWQAIPALPAPALADLCRFYADLGIAGVLATQLHAAPWAPLAVAASATPALQVASGVAIATSRSPFETAMSAIELDVVTEGRLVLGLGSGTTEWCRRLYDVEVTRPVEVLAEIVAAIRLIIHGLAHGELPSHAGRHVTFDLAGIHPTVRPVRDHLPIAIGGLGAPMARLAGRVGDGLIGHPLWTPRWIDEVIEPARRAGLAAEGRSNDACPRMHWVLTVVSTDVGQAVEDAKRSVAFYAAMPAYEHLFAWHGFADAAAAAQAMVAAGRAEEAHQAIPDDLAHGLAIIGPPGKVAGALHERRSAAEAVCPVPPLAVPWHRQEQYAAGIVDVLARLV